MIVVLPLLALLPVGLLLYYIYHKDHDPEPFKTLAVTFVLGCATVVPAMALEMSVDIDTPVVENFLIVAPVEEMVKMAVVMLYIWRHKDFDDSFDAIVYSVMASLGFAAIENLIYVMQNGWEVGIMRAIFSVPGHCAFAIFMGFFIGKAKNHFYHQRKSMMWKCLVASFLVAVAVHGIYDILLCHSDYFLWFVIFVLAMDVFAFMLVRNAARNDHPLIIDK